MQLLCFLVCFHKAKTKSSLDTAYTGGQNKKMCVRYLLIRFAPYNFCNIQTNGAAYTGHSTGDSRVMHNHFKTFLIQPQSVIYLF